jgi:hypothetical protein
VSIAGPASLKCGVTAPPVESRAAQVDGAGELILREYTIMLAEKFILLLETLKSHVHTDGSPRVVSTSPHIPIKLPGRNGK